jgi:site-specific DNA recombinase
MARRLRCAIYTRKSSEEGLDQDFNSLDAQHEACAAFIASQKAEGWVPVATRYDDGGLSGGTLERPALQRLLADIGTGLVDQIVVYKIDRLTRSLADFAKIVDRLDAGGASFVSVTQSFNTATSMGRLTLNMLLSFAQFEREVTAERIRDKIAASKRKGLWMGGAVPFGYQPKGRSLTIDGAEAMVVRDLYALYLDLGSARAVAERAAELGYRTRVRVSGAGRTSGGIAFTRGHVHQILTNPLYAGRIRHHDKVYDGQHPAIIAPDLWQAVQDALTGAAARGRGTTNTSTSSPLVGKLFDETGDRLTPSHAQKNGKRLRYYISRRLVTDLREAHPDAWRLPACEIESGIAQLIRAHLSKPTLLFALVPDIAATEVAALNDRFNALLNAQSNEGYPTHGADNLMSLLRRADLAQGRVELRLDRQAIARRLGLPPDRLSPEGRKIIAPFRLQRRGVETKIVLGDRIPRPDAVLARNIVTARRWYQAIRDGASFTDVARRNKTTTSRVQQMISLAFLAPQILDQISAGSQPLGLTSEWIKRHPLPSDWQAQRDAIALL